MQLRSSYYQQQQQQQQPTGGYYAVASNGYSTQPMQQVRAAPRWGGFQKQVGLTLAPSTLRTWP